MVYTKAKQKVRKVYSRGKSIFGATFSKILMSWGLRRVRSKMHFQEKK